MLSAGKDAQPAPKADTRAHGERRYPRDSETPEGGTLRLPCRRKRPQKPATASGSEERTEKRHHPKTNRESAPGLYGRLDVLSAGKDAQPEPKADTRTHRERRYPRDFETLRAARFGFAIVGNDIKNPPWLPTTNHEPIRRTEKRHHSQTNRESAPTPLRTSRPCPQRRRTRSPSPRPTRAHTGH